MVLYYGVKNRCSSALFIIAPLLSVALKVWFQLATYCQLEPLFWSNWKFISSMAANPKTAGLFIWRVRQEQIEIAPAVEAVIGFFSNLG